jgi:hypothetical protein
MADVIFINRTDVKWNDTYDSYMINSVVGGDTEAGASLTLGGSEILSATGVIVSSAVCTITTGIAELLASSNSITSSTLADLILGVDEPMTSTIISQSTLSGFITMGEAEDLSGTSSCESTTLQDLSLGIVEIVTSSITTTSVTAGPLLTIGIGELLTSTASCVSVTTVLLDLGVSELLASTSINASTSDAWLQMGIVEPLTATATSVVAETTKELTMGLDTPVSTGVVVQSLSVSLLDLGVSELLASTNPIVSTVSAAVLTLGISEDLTSTINVISVLTSPDLILGITEVLTATASTVIPVSDSGLTIGIQEATASTGAIVSTVLNSVLTMGESTPLSSTINLESIVSSFLNIGITEVLEATITSTTISGGAAADLILGQQELLAGTRATVSNTVAELTLGIDTELSRRFSNPPFTADDNTDNTVVLINFDGNTNDESGNDFDAILYGDAILDTSGIYGSSGSVKVYEDPVRVGGSGSDLFDWGGNDFCIEVAFKDTTSTIYNNNGAGNYIFKKGTIVDLNDHMAFYYTYQSSSVVRFTWTTWEDHDGWGYASDIVFDYPRALLSYWKHVTINRINNEIFIKFNGSDNDFTYINNANTLNGWPDIVWDNLELGGFQSSVSNPRFSIDALRITKDDAVYPADNFDLFQDKDVISLITADVTLGLAEVLASTDSNGSSVTAELELGVEVPMTASFTIESIVFGVSLILGITEVLSATDNVVSTTSGLITLGISELLASTIANTSTATDSTLIIGGSEILASTGGVQISSLVGVPNLVLGISEPLSSTSSNVINVSDITLLSGANEILTSPIDITSNVSIPNLIIGQFEYLSSTQNTVSTVSNSALILGITEDLSASIGPIGTVSTSLLDLGVTEILADVDNALVVSVTADLTIGGIVEELAHTLYEFSSGPLDPYAVSTTPLATMDLGVDEVLGVSQSSTSSTDAVLSLGAAEILSSTINITSTENSSITMGIVEELSDECVSWTSISGLLVVGLTEILSSTSISNSVADAVLSFGVPESLSHNIGDGDIPGQSLDTGDLFIDGETFIQDENETHTITAQGGAAVSTDQFKYGTSSVYFDGDGDGITIPDHTDFDVQANFTFDTYAYISTMTNWARLFIIQNDEDNWFQVYIYNNQIVCRLNKGGVLYDGIISGTLTAGSFYHIAFTHVHATNTMEMYIEGVEKTGTTDVAMEAIEYFHGYLDNIRWEKDTIRWTSDFDSESALDMGYEIAVIPELYSVSNVVADLTQGHIEELSHTAIITTEADGLTLVTGVAEVLATASFSVSVTTADLFMGVVEDLSATINAVSNISSILTLGADTPLAHTITGTFAEVTGVANLGFGVSEYMGTANVSQSTADASLVLGTTEILSATSSIDVTGIANLGFGIVETASVSTSFTSSSNAVLTLGVTEILTATSSPDAAVDADITMGADTPMTGSNGVQSYVVGTIIFGVNELLASTTITASTSEASLILGVDEPMTATGIVVSNTAAFISFGVVESLSATQSFVSTADSVAILGVEEVLAATNALAQSNAAAIMDTGGIELVNGTSGPTSYAVALLDLGVSELLAGTQPIVSNVAANLTLGVVEDLSHTALEAPSSPTYGSDLTDTLGGTPWASHYDYPQDSTLVFDNDADTYWIASYDEDPYPYTLRFDFESNNTAVQRYTLSLPLAFGGKGGEDWTFEGSDNNGIDWTVLDTQTGISWTAGETKTFSFSNLNDYRYYRWVFTKGEHAVDLVVGEAQLLQYNEPYTHTLDVADSSVAAAVITMGVDESLSSTINFTASADGTIAAGIIEMLATLGFGNTVADGLLTLGVDEPLSATTNIVNDSAGDLGIPGAIEYGTGTSSITTSADASSLDTGVTEVVSAFKMIWSQIHTPELTLGITELFNGTSSSTSLVGTADLIKGIAEVMSSTTISNSVADASLTLGIGEYVSSTVNVSSTSDALLSTGDDELLASSIISTGAVAGEMIFGLVEVMSATNITTSMTIGQIYAGISEILEGSSSSSTDVNNAADCMALFMQFRHSGEHSSKGGLFKTT